MNTHKISKKDLKINEADAYEEFLQGKSNLNDSRGGMSNIDLLH